jgi:RNA polymerase sigma factor (sigma-70 family)
VTSGVEQELEACALAPAGSDENLVSQCLQGSEEAWCALVDKYRNLVYSVPMKYRMSPDDAADVFQSVWTDLFSELPRLRNAGSLRSWLVTVAGHKCYQWKRKQNVLAQSSDLAAELAAPNPTYLDWRQEVEREQMLRDALMELPPRCREMVRMLFFEQPAIPYKDIAERLGLAEGSIGFIRGRCLNKLRSALDQKGF